jgi:nitroimidazol reductase NimA-like FMN-containing flavoprotein (pyridoxamine 5'-phosphate oxidase superfamily)
MYLIPLGYVWVDAAMYGVGERGRKTELAAREPGVAFQVDTAMETGLFEWESVTGTGQFTVVSEPGEARRALTEMQSFMAGAPDWWRAEQAPRMVQGTLIVWRITPTAFAGSRFAR